MAEADRRQAAHDALLAWCSELGSGTWEQFKRAVAHLRLGGPTRVARGLSVLGHVEFDWRARRFACAPATLTTIQDMPGRFLVCGQRPLGHLEGLRLAAEHAGADVDVAREPAHQFGAGPGTVIIDADPAEAAEFARIAGLRFAPDSARAIAGELPALSLETAGEPTAPDERFPGCPVDPDTLIDRWDAPADGGGYTDGLWAWRTLRRRRAVYLRRDGQWWHLPISEHGPYLIERPKDAPELLRHDPANRILIVDGRAPLPELHARAAVLCSGRLPLPQPYAPGFSDDHYVNVPTEIAAAIIANLTEASP